MIREPLKINSSSESFIEALKQLYFIGFKKRKIGHISWKYFLQDILYINNIEFYDLHIFISIRASKLSIFRKKIDVTKDIPDFCKKELLIYIDSCWEKYNDNKRQKLMKMYHAIKKNE